MTTTHLGALGAALLALIALEPASREAAPPPMTPEPTARPSECDGCHAQSGVPVVNSVPGLSLSFSTSGADGDCYELDESCTEFNPCELYVDLTIVNDTGGNVYVYSPNGNTLIANGGSTVMSVKFGTEGEVPCGDVENQVSVDTDSGMAFSINMRCGECAY